MAELKSCPFCGGEADVMDNADEQVSYRAFGYGTRGYPTWYKCYCTRCGAMGEISRIEKGCEMNTTYERWAKERAIEKWNTRTTVDDESGAVYVVSEASRNRRTSIYVEEATRGSK